MVFSAAESSPRLATVFLASIGAAKVMPKIVARVNKTLNCMLVMIDAIELLVVDVTR